MLQFSFFLELSCGKGPQPSGIFPRLALHHLVSPEFLVSCQVDTIKWCCWVEFKNKIRTGSDV